MTLFSNACEPLGVTSNDRQPWLEARRSLFTASDAAAILGLDPWRGPLEVYASKVAPQQDEEDTEASFWRKLRGLAMERPIIDEWAKRNGHTIVGGGELLRSKAYPMLGATLDAEVTHQDGRKGIAEAKTTDMENEWREETDGRKEWKAPVKVHCQAAQQQIVTQCDFATIVLLPQRTLRLQAFDVVVPDSFVQHLLCEVDRMHDRVRDLRPPDPTGSASDKRALKALAPVDDGAALELAGQQWVDLRQDLWIVKKEISKLKQREERIKQEFQLAIGESKTADLRDGTWMTLKTQTSKSTCAECNHEKISKPFRVLRRHKTQNFGPWEEQ